MKLIYKNKRQCKLCLDVEQHIAFINSFYPQQVSDALAVVKNNSQHNVCLDYNKKNCYVLYKKEINLGLKRSNLNFLYWKELKDEDIVFVISTESESEVDSLIEEYSKKCLILEDQGLNINIQNANLNWGKLPFQLDNLKKNFIKYKQDNHFNNKQLASILDESYRVFCLSLKPDGKFTERMIEKIIKLGIGFN